MKPRWKLIVLAVLTAAVVISLAGVALAGGPGWRTGTDGENPSAGAAASKAAGSTAVTPLSPAEEDELVFLREEEKLARDVYLALYDEWGVSVFKNIAASESRHMASVKTLLDRYGVEDPVCADTPGVFADAGLQTLYNELVTQGRLSVEQAYGVGVAIEEMDILDLKEIIAISTHRDVTRVAENLLAGSENHLAAFTRLLNQ